MEFLSHLWLPILLASIAVWFWAFLSFAILSIHRRDWKRLPNEDAFAGAVRPLSIPPGVYGRAKVTAVMDGVIQGLITGAVFAAFWPA